MLFFCTELEKQMKSNVAEKIAEYFKLIMLAAAYLACIFSPPSVYALQPPPPLDDFNTDGVSDIIVKRVGTGQAVLWFMKKDGTKSSTKTLLANDGTWKLVICE